MKQYMQTHIYITLTLLVLAGAVALGASVANHNQKEIESLLRAKLDAGKVNLVAIAETTDRNGADQTIGEVVTNCERRDEYESLLVKLSSLTKKDLVLLQGLFEECGSFQGEQKVLMVAKLERELEEYSNLLALLSTLTEKGIDAYQEDVWKDIVANEKLRGNLLRDLNQTQEEIISELISGYVVQGTRVRTLLKEIEDINQLLTMYDQKIDEGRGIITP